MASATPEMEDRHHFLVNHAILITDVGPLVVRSREEVKNLIHFRFGICKHEFMVYHSNLEPFTTIEKPSGQFLSLIVMNH
jgi:hypothetical protein